MPALKYAQLQMVVDRINEYCFESQLQDVVLTERYLLLQHYGKGPFTIGINLNPIAPELGYYFGEIPQKKTLVKPLVLFLRAHAKNLRLSKLRMDLSWGRVVRFYYEGGARQCSIEVRLIPHGLNVIVEAEHKRLSLFPIKVLPASIATGDAGSEVFDLEAYLDHWNHTLFERGARISKASPAIDIERKKEKEITKKSALIEKLERDMLSLNKPWSQLGEYLKIHQSTEVPEDWKEYLDPQLPLNANMQRCFEKHKSQEQRRMQILERIHHLQEEVQKLRRPDAEHEVELELERTVRSSAGELLSKAKAKGRKLKLSDNIEAVFGKSAKDNLALLRKAQAWDLWLHLRDLPGAHLIVRRPRNQNVDHYLLLKAAQWLLSETIGRKKIIKGDRYDVIVTECRHVRPIKGDRLGRVHYQNETTLNLRVE